MWKDNRSFIFNNQIFYLLLTKRILTSFWQKKYRNNFVSEWWLDNFFLNEKKNRFTIKQRFGWYIKKKNIFLKNKNKIVKRFIIPRFRDFRFDFFQKLILFRLYKIGRFCFGKLKRFIGFLFYVRRKNYFIIGYNMFNGRTISSTSAGCTGIKKTSSRKYFFTFRNFKNRARFVWYRTFYKAFGNQLKYLNIQKRIDQKELIERKLYLNIIKRSYVKIKKKLKKDFIKFIKKNENLSIVSELPFEFFLSFLNYLNFKIRKELKREKVFELVFFRKIEKYKKKFERLFRRRKKNIVYFNLDLKLYSFERANLVLYEIFLYKLLRLHYYKVKQFRLIPDAFNIHYGIENKGRLKLANKRRL